MMTWAARQQRAELDALMERWRKQAVEYTKRGERQLAQELLACRAELGQILHK